MTLLEALVASKCEYNDLSRYPESSVRIRGDQLLRINKMAKRLGVTQKRLVEAFLLMCLEKFEGWAITDEDRAYLE